MPDSRTEIDVPGFGRIEAQAEGRQVTTNLPEQLPDWINASDRRVAITTPEGRITITGSKTEVFNYFPGWHQPATMFELLINKDRWEDLDEISPGLGAVATQEPDGGRLQRLDAAEDLFAQKGYAAASVRDIVAAAECNLAAVNYHFGSKDGLVAAARLVGRGVERQGLAPV